MGSVVIARWGGAWRKFARISVKWGVLGCWWWQIYGTTVRYFMWKSHVRTSVFPWERLLEVSGALGKNVSSSINWLFVNEDVELPVSEVEQSINAVHSNGCESLAFIDVPFIFIYILWSKSRWKLNLLCFYLYKCLGATVVMSWHHMMKSFVSLWSLNQTEKNLPSVKCMSAAVEWLLLADWIGFYW